MLAQISNRDAVSKPFELIASQRRSDSIPAKLDVLWLVFKSYSATSADTAIRSINAEAVKLRAVSRAVATGGTEQQEELIRQDEEGQHLSCIVIATCETQSRNLPQCVAGTPRWTSQLFSSESNRQTTPLTSSHQFIIKLTIIQNGFCHTYFRLCYPGDYPSSVLAGHVLHLQSRGSTL